MLRSPNATCGVTWIPPYHRPENTAMMINVITQTMPIMPEHLSSHRDLVQLPRPPVNVVNMAKLVNATHIIDSVLSVVGICASKYAEYPSARAMTRNCWIVIMPYTLVDFFPIFSLY